MATKGPYAAVSWRHVHSNQASELKLIRGTRSHRRLHATEQHRVDQRLVCTLLPDMLRLQSVVVSCAKGHKAHKQFRCCRVGPLAAH